MFHRRGNPTKIHHAFFGKSLIRALEIAKGRGAKTICLTAFDGSPITRVADCTILCISSEIQMIGESYTNTVAQKILLDVIYNSLAMDKLTPKKMEELIALLNEGRY